MLIHREGMFFSKDVVTRTMKAGCVEARAAETSASSFAPKENLNSFLKKKKEEYSFYALPEGKSSDDFEGAHVAIWKQTDAWVHCCESESGPAPSIAKFCSFHIKTDFVHRWFPIVFIFHSTDIKVLQAFIKKYEPRGASFSKEEVVIISED